VNDGNGQGSKYLELDRDLAECEYQRMRQMVFEGHYPDYGYILWDGNVAQMMFTVKFKWSPDDPLDRVQRRAVWFLDKLRQKGLWWMANIEMRSKARVLEYAVVKVRAEFWDVFRFGTDLLNELPDIVKVR
jgi:hypothetical protein